MSDEDLSTFLTWLNEDKKGKCKACDIGIFYQKNPAIKNFGKLKKFCNKHSTHLQYAFENNVATISLHVGSAESIIWTSSFNITNEEISNAVSQLEMGGFNGQYTGREKYFINELRYRTSWNSMEALYPDHLRVDHFLASTDCLTDMANKIGNITTTHLAKVLCGKKCLAHAVSHDGTEWVTKI
jgi:hypothetical protein